MNNNLNNSSISGFGALLYYSFIIKKKYRVDAIAKEMQIATDTLYRYVRGENVMPPDRIADLIRVTGELEFIEFFLPKGFRVVHENEIKDGKNDHQIVEISILSGKVQEVVEQAYADGKIDKLESKSITRKVADLQHVLSEISEKVKREVG